MFILLASFNSWINYWQSIYTQLLSRINVKIYLGESRSIIVIKLFEKYRILYKSWNFQHIISWWKRWLYDFRFSRATNCFFYWFQFEKSIWNWCFLVHVSQNHYNLTLDYHVLCKYPLLMILVLIPFQFLLPSEIFHELTL